MANILIVGVLLTGGLLGGFNASHAQTSAPPPPALQNLRGVLNQMGNPRGVVAYTPPAANCGFSPIANSQSPALLRELIIWRNGRAYLRASSDLYCPLAVQQQPVLQAQRPTPLLPRILLLSWDANYLAATTDAELLSANRSKSRLAPANMRLQCAERLRAVQSIQVTRAETASDSIARTSTSTIEFETTTNVGTCREFMRTDLNLRPAPRSMRVGPAQFHVPFVTPRLPAEKQNQGRNGQGAE